MDKNKTSVMEKIEETMACTAYAEAGEPCPLDKDLQEVEEKKSIVEGSEDTMACTAYAEAGEPCPINQG